MAKVWAYDAEIHGRFPSVELRDAFVRDVQALAAKYGLTPKKVPATIYVGTVFKPAEATEPVVLPVPPPAPAKHLSLVPPLDGGPKAG